MLCSQKEKILGLAFSQSPLHPLWPLVVEEKGKEMLRRRKRRHLRKSFPVRTLRS